jgi:hypothetical protein
MQKQFSSTLRKRLSAIRTKEKEHLDLGLKMLAADHGAFFGLDMFAIGSMKRSVAHCSGFRHLIVERNFICAASILRMQLDNALRFYAAWIVDNPHEFATRVLNGVQVNKIRDKTGALMTDAYLVKSLSKEYPWIGKVYQETSGYVHFSHKHIMHAMDGYDSTSRSARIRISGRDKELPEHIYLDAVEAFIAATDIFLRYLNGWIVTKASPELLSKKG